MSPFAFSHTEIGMILLLVSLTICAKLAGERDGNGAYSGFAPLTLILAAVGVAVMAGIFLLIGLIGPRPSHL
jgi:hypothetical protein